MSPTAKRLDETPLAQPDMRAAALALASYGLRVFPVKAGAKSPPILDFPARATTDAARIVAWWSEITGEPETRNIGILTGGDLLVVDTDTHEIPGADELADPAARADLRSVQLQSRIGPFPPTWCARTARGGLHHFFRTAPDARIANSARKLGPSIDVRGHHGYVIGAGSEVADGAYRWVEGRSPADLPLADAPAALVAECRRHGTVSERDPAKSQAPLCLLDTDASIARARAHLASSKPAIVGLGGRVDTMAVANKLMDFGLTPSTAADIMCAHGWNTRCEPPWDLEELATFVESLVGSRRSPIGSDWRPARISIEDAFEAVETDPIAEGITPATGLRWESAESAAEIAMEMLADQLVEGLLDQTSVTMLFGPPNVGKTAIALAISWAVASREPLGGRAVEGGPVVYFAAEGGNGIRNRFAAMRCAHGGPLDLPLYLIADPLVLFRDKKAQRQLVDTVRAIEKVTGQQTKLIVLDTFGDVFAGGNENDASEVTAFYQQIFDVRAQLGCAIMLLHHTGKDEALGERGSTALRAKCDTSIRVKGAVAGGGGVLIPKKQRDMAFGADIPYRLFSVTIGRTPKGKPRTGVLAKFSDAGDVFRPAPTPQERWLLDCLIGAIGDRDGVSSSEWNDRATDDLRATGKPVLSKPTLSGLRKALREKGWIVETDTLAYRPAQ